MTNDSRLIAQTFHEMRLFCRDMALLLKTGEEIFKRQGWETAQPDKACVYAGSYSLERPQAWLPLRYFRYYSHSDYPCVLAYLAVIVRLPAGREIEDGMTYLTAGGLTYQQPKGWGKGLTGSETKLFHWHLVRRDAQYDGTPLPHRKPFEWAESDQPSHWAKLIANVESAVTLGLPLHEITDAAQLEDRIIKPLITEVTKTHRSA